MITPTAFATGLIVALGELFGGFPAPELQTASTNVASAADTLEGSVWKFCEKEPSFVFFVAGGHVKFASAVLACEGSWTRSGDHVVFDCNGVTTFDVHVDGTKMTGTWFRTKEPTEHAATCLTRSDKQ